MFAYMHAVLGIVHPRRKLYHLAISPLFFRQSHYATSASLEVTLYPWLAFFLSLPSTKPVSPCIAGFYFLGFSSDMCHMLLRGKQIESAIKS